MERLCGEDSGSGSEVVFSAGASLPPGAARQRENGTQQRLAGFASGRPPGWDGTVIAVISVQRPSRFALPHRPPTRGMACRHGRRRCGRQTPSENDTTTHPPPGEADQRSGDPQPVVENRVQRLGSLPGQSLATAYR
jgi:hypothetical protein